MTSTAPLPGFTPDPWADLRPLECLCCAGFGVPGLEVERWVIGCAAQGLECPVLRTQQRERARAVQVSPLQQSRPSHVCPNKDLPAPAARRPINTFQGQSEPQRDESLRRVIRGHVHFGKPFLPEI